MTGFWAGLGLGIILGALSGALGAVFLLHWWIEQRYLLEQARQRVDGNDG